jgi:hypothetical protein
MGERETRRKGVSSLAHEVSSRPTGSTIAHRGRLPLKAVSRSGSTDWPIMTPHARDGTQDACDSRSLGDLKWGGVSLIRRYQVRGCAAPMSAKLGHVPLNGDEVERVILA